MNRLLRINELKEKRRLALEKIPGPIGAQGLDGLDGADGLDGRDGVPGEQGKQGPSGRPGRDGHDGVGVQGKQGPRGEPGLIWLGEWEVLRQYGLNEAVACYGSAFICIQPHQAKRVNKPQTGEQWKQFWAVLAERGESGPGGAPGIQGVQGPQGPKGDPGGGGSSQIYNEVPSGVLNGTNKVFTLANSYVSLSIRLFWNGQRQIDPADFSETGVGEITMISAPSFGDKLVVDYEKV